MGVRISRSGENVVRTSNKVADRLRYPGKRRFGGDPLVDPATGISTESHMELWRRLARDGAHMHGPPGPPRPRKTS